MEELQSHDGTWPKSVHPLTYGLKNQTRHDDECLSIWTEIDSSIMSVQNINTVYTEVDIY